MTRDDTTPEPEALEVLKGSRERILIREWENKGSRYVSVATQTLGNAGEYVFMRGRSFALRPGEARELAAALVSTAATVEAATTGDERD